MRLDIKQNAKRGIGVGIIYRVITMILPFISRSIFIHVLGSEYVGLAGLFTSVLSVLSLAELGIGNAIVYSMYKPVAENDEETICALLRLYRRIYRFIALIVFVLGMVIMPFLKYLIKGSYPESVNLQLLFLLFLLNLVASYGICAYKSSILFAYQRVDITYIINAVTSVMFISCQIVVLILTKNLYLYFAISIITTVTNNIFTSYYVTKKYPQFSCHGFMTHNAVKDIRKNVLGMMIGRVCEVSKNSFDSIFISACVSLTENAKYTNYFYVMNSLNLLCFTVLESLKAGIGNSVATDTKQTNFNVMLKINTIYLVLGGWMAICMLCLYQPFMVLWAGSDNLFPVQTMLLFPIYFYAQKMSDIKNLYAEGAGLFWNDRFRKVLEAVLNIVLNYVFVRIWGVWGIIFATILTVFFIGFGGSTIVAFKYYFGSGCKKFLINQLFCLVITLVTGYIGYNLCNAITIENIFLSLLARIVVCVTVIPILMWGMMHLSGKYGELKEWCLDILCFSKRTD